MKTYSNLTRAERIEKIISQRRNDLALVLENLTEEQNISSILRTAEAFGVGLVYIIYGDKKPKLSKKVSSGANKWLSVKYYKSIKSCLNKLKKDNFKVIGALVDPTVDLLWNQSLEGKIAIVVGNEVKGMSAGAEKLADKNLYLPMYGLTESLNVSVATALFIYEVIRQKEVSK